jgi:entericidin B
MIRRILQPLMAIVFAAGVLGALAGCNTIEGVGADIQHGGKAIKDEAKEHNRNK